AGREAVLPRRNGCASRGGQDDRLGIFAAGAEAQPALRSATVPGCQTGVGRVVSASVFIWMNSHRGHRRTQRNHLIPSLPSVLCGALRRLTVFTNLKAGINGRGCRMSLCTIRRPIMDGALRGLLLSAITISLFVDASAHPLGNFTINHFARIESGAAGARIRYVVDLAEVPAFQESQKADLDGDGNLTEAELNAYLDRVTPGYLAGLKLTVDGAPVALRLTGKNVSKRPGAAGLFTLRIVYELTGEFAVASAAPRFRFENANMTDRAGWREIVVASASGVKVFDSTAYGGGVTDELRAYPADLLMAPLDERVAEWSATAGPLPAGAKPLTLRDGKPV